MLNIIDTVISYAVIMAVVSLLITLVVQMFSAAFSLRGKNLANALALTFQTIDPSIEDQAHALAQHILTDPILSDSLWVKKTRQYVTSARVQRAYKAAVQAHEAAGAALEKARNASANANAAPAALPVVAAPADNQPAVPPVEPADVALPVSAGPASPNILLNALGSAAEARALKELKTAKEAVDKAAGKLLPPALRKQPWSNSPWSALWHLFDAFRLATAVRPGEVYRILHELSGPSSGQDDLRPIPNGIRTRAASLLRALAQSDQPTDEARQKLEAVEEMAKLFTTDEQKKAVMDSFVQLGTTVERATTQSYDRFQRWFGSAQDRAEQWFQTHVRVITVIASFLAAILLQLDTIYIFRLLHRSPGMVQALVNSAPGVVAQGDAMLNPATSTGGVDTLGKAAYHLWQQDHPLYSLDPEPDQPTIQAYRDALAKRLANGPNPKYLLHEFDHAVTAATKPAQSGKPLPKSSAPPADPPTPAASPVLLAYRAWAKRFPAYALEKEPAPTGEIAEQQTAVDKLLTDHLQTIGEAQEKTKDKGGKSWQDEYGLAVVKSHQGEIEMLANDLNQTGFDVVPPAYMSRYQPAGPHHHHQEWRKEFAMWIKFTVAQTWQHLVGTLITAGLLTLGAPFWFNLLKNLMSLRPAVASIIERRPQSSPALPQNPVAPAPPS